MGKIYALLIAVVLLTQAQSQNIGFGTTTPLMKLHVRSSDSALVLLENTQELSNSVSVGINFKTGSTVTSFTGAIKTIGESTATARIGFFTGTSVSANGLLERLSITNDGKVGIGTTTPQAAFEINTTTSGFLPPRLDSNQRNAILSPPVGLTIYNTSKKAYESFNGAQWYTTVHFIGEYYGGGIVFYTYDNGQHGLIATTSDQSTGAFWYNSSFKNTGTTGDGVGAGAMNTAMQVSGQIGDNINGNFAAKLCADYTVTIAGITYGDWYLPSKHELNLLFAQKDLVGNFATEFYWSSTEFNNTEAWYQLFTFGNQAKNGKQYPAYVRAIRAF